MSEDIFLKLLPDNSDIEKHAIEYLFKNPSLINKYPKEYFHNRLYRLFYDSLDHLKQNNLTFDIDIIERYIKNENPNFDESTLIEIVDNAKNKSIDNQQYVFQQLKNYQVQKKTFSKFNKLLTVISEKNNFSIDEVRKQVNVLQENLFDTENSLLLDGKQLAENYKVTMAKRKSGLVTRSLGFPIFNKYLTRPGAAGEMTGIVADKGAGKSIICKCIEKELVDQKVCVLSINLEMSEESTMDRKMCLETGYPLREILKLEAQNIEADINIELEKIKESPYYLFYKEPELSLDQLDTLLFEAKEILRSKRVLPEDEYIVVSIDLTGMLTEISSARNVFALEDATNKLHRICKKHLCHIINLFQANENKMRNGKVFTKPESLDFYKVGLEDIKNGSVYSERCRVIMTLTRPLQLKKRHFPEQMEQWDLETDFINCNIVKQNDGAEGFIQFVFGENFNIYPFKE